MPLASGAEARHIRNRGIAVTAAKRVLLGSVLMLSATMAPPALAVGLIGIRGGVSVASVSLDINQTFSEENRTGFAGSGFLSMGLGVITIQPEVSYIQKGAKDATTGSELKLDYFEVAGLAKFGLPIPVVTPHAFAGFAADFEVDKSSKFAVDTSSVDYNLLFGVDVEFHLGKLVIVGDGRYALGLTDVSEASEVVKDLKNRAWILSAGLAHAF